MTLQPDFRTQPRSTARVLVSAYACNPNRGSEEAVGWNWVQAIARSHPVTVLTAAFHETDIRSACDPLDNPRFIFVPHRRWHYHPTPLWRRIENSLAKPLMNLAYAAWQRDAYALAKRLHRDDGFDLTHQLTYVGFRFPGHLWKLGLPFVWGPIGGLENTRWRLLPAMGAKGAIYYGARNLINMAQRRWLRSPRTAAAAAGPGLIAATDSISRELMALYAAPSTVIGEVVAPVELSPARPPARTAGEPLRIMWSGGHLPGKALNLLIQALACIPPDRNLEVHVIGDGPMRQSWERLAERLGVDRRFIWHGQLPRHEALLIMASGHALAITSLKDLTSTVLLEGLALGLPVVCPDHCGFSGVVVHGCGIKVDPTSSSQLVKGIADALLLLEADEAARLHMGEAALARARDFSGAMLESRLETVYASVLSDPFAQSSRALT